MAALVGGQGGEVAHARPRGRGRDLAQHLLEALEEALGGGGRRPLPVVERLDEEALVAVGVDGQAVVQALEQVDVAPELRGHRGVLVHEQGAHDLLGGGDAAGVLDRGQRHVLVGAHGQREGAQVAEPVDQRLPRVDPRAHGRGGHEHPHDGVGRHGRRAPARARGPVDEVGQPGLLSEHQRERALQHGREGEIVGLGERTQRIGERTGQPQRAAPGLLGRVGPARRGRRRGVAERVLPERQRLGVAGALVGPAREGGEGVGPWAVRGRVAPLVGVEQLAQDQHPRAAVDDRVVVAPHQPGLGRAEPAQHEPHQGWGGGVEAGGAVGP